MIRVAVVWVILVMLGMLAIPTPGYAAANDPSELLALASSSTTVELKWSKGADTPYSIVRRSTTGYPAGPADGTLVYDGPLSSYQDTGLTAGASYYYRVWGQDSGAWLTPNSHSDPDSKWTDEAQAYDDNLGTWATNLSANYGHYLELIPAASFLCEGLRIYGVDVGGGNHDPEIAWALFADGAWYPSSSGPISMLAWEEFAFHSYHWVEKVRIKSNSSIYDLLLYEFDFWDAQESSGYSSDMVTLPLTSEPESPDIEGPEQPSQWFQVPNADLLDSIPGSELIDDAGDALGFPQGSMWVMVLVTVAIMFGTGAQVFFHNTLIAIGIGTVAMALFGIVGILPLWIMFVFLIMGIGTSFAIARM